MEFGFTEEEEAFRHEIRIFLKENLPSTQKLFVINPAEDPFRDDVWEVQRAMARKFGEKGWVSLDWPKEYGGKEGSPMLRAILQEEMGYSGAPGGTAGAMMVAPLLFRFGTTAKNRLSGDQVNAAPKRPPKSSSMSSLSFFPSG